MKFLFIVNCSSFFKSHFLNLAVSVKERGCMVYIASGNDKQRKYFESLGFTFELLPISRSGKNFFQELKTIYAIRSLILRYKPDHVHMFTIKPVLYGGIVNRLLSKNRPVKSIFSVTGLGSASMSQSMKGRLLWKSLNLVYKFIFNVDNSSVIFENADDQDLFIQSGIVSVHKSSIVNGAGVDMVEFSPSCTKSTPVSVILVARLLKDKGVREYIDAGRILKEREVPVELLLVGSIDPENPSSMTDNDIQIASKNGYVKVLGFRSDIAECYRNADIACLPSYREGLPKSLIEATACGLPIITTDVPGCRQMVHGGENGILVPAKNSMLLARAIENMVNNSKMREKMGIRSREIAEERYSYETIISSFLSVYDLK
ncbi:glycosyltransferase family 1 protein [Vibrio cholerae]|nr:glycosyltransferase family 1 protein [Vibrio cholerae]